VNMDDEKIQSQLVEWKINVEEGMDMNTIREIFKLYSDGKYLSFMCVGGFGKGVQMILKELSIPSKLVLHCLWSLSFLFCEATV
jgi:hypothetical protein